MPRGLRRYHESGHSHFVTFSCYRRQPNFSSGEIYDLFTGCLERMRRRFDMCVYGYVVMPEHVHLLLSEPERDTLARCPTHSFGWNEWDQPTVVSQFEFSKFLTSSSNAFGHAFLKNSACDSGVSSLLRSPASLLHSA